MKTLLFTMTTLMLVGCGNRLARRPLNSDERTYQLNAMHQPIDFYVPKDKARDVWGRLQAYVAQASSMKVQTATDYILQTYNPTGWTEAYGYQLSQAPSGDSVRFKIDCQTNQGGFESAADQNAHVGAYYAVTGKDAPGVLIRQ